MHSSLAVFLWTFQRKWRGFAVFLVATAVLILVITNVYPAFSEVQGKAVAEALGGDVDVSLTQDDAESGDYTLRWSKYGGADGYVVVESDTDIPLALVSSMDASEVNLPLLATFLPGVGKVSVRIFDAATTQTPVTGLSKRYGSEDALVYFGVLAFRGEPSNARVEGASQMVNTRDLVAKNPYHALMKHPLMKAFVGSDSVDVFSVKGFLCMELFSGLTLYIIIYFLIQYAGAFCCEMENKTIDVILSTPLSRRGLFVGRYLSWVAMDAILIVSWIALIHIGILAIGRSADVPLADVAGIMISYLPFLLAVQGFCMLISVLTNQSQKAYGVCFGVYFGMFVLRIVAMLSEKLNFLKYFAVTYYWDYNIIFLDRIVPWGSIAVLAILSVGLFMAGLIAFERKDLAA